MSTSTSVRGAATEARRTMSHSAGFMEKLKEKGTLLPGVNSMRRAKVVFARDCSGSMDGEKAQHAQRGSEEAIAELGNPANRGAFLVGVIDFSDAATVVVELTPAADLMSGVPPMNVGGGTAIGACLEAIEAMLLQPHPDDDRCLGNLATIIIFTDGQNMEGPDPVAVSQRLKSNKALNVLILAIGIGDDAEWNMLKAIATSPEHALQVNSGADLRKFLPEITKTLSHTLRQGGDARKTLKMSEIQKTGETRQ